MRPIQSPWESGQRPLKKANLRVDPFDDLGVFQFKRQEWIDDPGQAIQQNLRFDGGFEMRKFLRFDTRLDDFGQGAAQKRLKLKHAGPLLIVGSHHQPVHFVVRAKFLFMKLVDRGREDLELGTRRFSLFERFADRRLK